MKKYKCRVLDTISDIIKLLGIAILSAVIISIVMFLIGVSAGGHGILSGLEVVKNGTLILASVGMIVIAGMLIKSGKNPEKPITNEGWRSHFKVVGFKTAIGVFSFVFLVLAEGADILLITKFM